MEPFVGQIIAVGFNFAPVGWMQCAGQILAISEYSTLFALLGTTYGGDGQSTFGLPDLRGRTPLGVGPQNAVGTLAGSESITLTTAQIGAHNHPVAASASAGTASVPASTLVLGQGTAEVNVYRLPGATTMLNSASIGPAGTVGPQPHENRQPFQTVNYVIATEGIFPSRS